MYGNNEVDDGSSWAVLYLSQESMQLISAEEVSFELFLCWPGTQ